jgi:hypothetical protein
MERRAKGRGSEWGKEGQEPGPWNLEPGTRNLELETWNMEFHPDEYRDWNPESLKISHNP